MEEQTKIDARDVQILSRKDKCLEVSRIKNEANNCMGEFCPTRIGYFYATVGGRFPPDANKKACP